jgi:uncharacterized NAD(P)/FAD-binding protein YdhS
MGRRVIIVGGGATGTAAFLAIVRHRAAASVDIVDPRPPGRGVVFDTTSPTFLCNTSAGVMSLNPERPNEFVHYLRRRGLAVGPDDFVPRRLVAEYCVDSYRRHAELARHIPDRARSLARRGSGYVVALEGGGELRADDVIVCTGTGPPVVPGLVRRHLGRPGLFPSSYPEPSLEPDARVLVLGTRLSAIDATLSLCLRGHRVTMASRSGRLPAVRTRIRRAAPLDRAAFLGLDLTDPALPSRVLRLVRRATSRPLAEQTSSATNPMVRLRQEIELAEAGHVDWQDVIPELIELMNDRLSTVDDSVRRTALSRCELLITRYVSAFPLRNARRLLHEFDRGAATLARGVPLQIEPDGDRWCVRWPDGVERFDAIVCATGYHPPVLSCHGTVLRLDRPGSVPELGTDLRMRFPGSADAERIWLLGTTSYLRVPVVNYLRTAADQADAIARSMVVPARRAA